MKCGVVTFPGSNCNHDMMYALGNILGQEVVELWHKDTDTENCELIVLPGGFSYGDYLRSGAIARFSPIMESVINHAKNGGLLLGICNGFQILCESVAKAALEVVLEENLASNAKRCRINLSDLRNRWHMI